MATNREVGLGEELRRRLRTLLELVVPHAMHRRGIRTGTRDEREIQLLPALCGAESTAIDVGANKGLYVHHMLISAGRVVAFEPVPLMIGQLERFYGSRISIESVALSDSNGSGQLRMPEGNSSRATMAPSNGLDRSGSLDVVDTEMRTLDSYDYRSVGLIKIDVEGHEEAVLRGARNTLVRERPNLIVEIEERHNPGSVQRVAALLAALDYTGLFVDGDLIRPFTQFDQEHDQGIEHIGLRGKTGRYVNNFVFVPVERADNVLCDASALLSAG